MMSINIETLKSGDQIFAFDTNLRKWIKCKIIQIEKYLVTLKDIEGSLKGIPWYETTNRLKNPDHYQQKC